MDVRFAPESGHWTRRSDVRHHHPLRWAHNSTAPPMIKVMPKPKKSKECGLAMIQAAPVPNASNALPMLSFQSMPADRLQEPEQTHRHLIMFNKAPA